MSSKPETRFIASVHEHLPVSLHREKMNNPYRGGTADVWYSGERADLWIEYKFLPRLPVRSAITADLTALQLAWLSGRYEEGRNVWVIIGCKAGGMMLTNKRWETPVAVLTFKQSLWTRKELARRIATHCKG